MKHNGPVTGHELKFGKGEDLITTTNAKGSITYFNDHFLNISGFDSDELQNKNHNVVRHPDMPTQAFKDLWDTLKSQKSWMGIVKNRAKNGDHYYVDAYVTPISKNGVVEEYQSVRTAPDQETVERAESIYERLRKNKPAIKYWHRFGFVSRVMTGFVLLIAILLSYVAIVTNLSAMQLGLGFAVGLAISYGLSKIIAAPVISLAKESRNSIDNDIARQVYGGSQSEISQLRLVLHMKNLESNSVISRIDDSSEHLNHIILRTTEVSQKTSEGVSIQLSEIEQLATAMNEMTATVQEVARNTAEAAHSAQSADQVVTKGKQDVTHTIESVTQVAEDMKQATSVVMELKDKSESIGTVLDVIRGIAEQTNLLALNAAIEAARAGEQGRGFAVVADEVRSLAQRTQESTQEIQSMIENMQSGAQNAAAAMDTGCQHVEGSVAQAEKAGASLDQISDIVKTISDMNLQIATATEEQSSVSEEINRNITIISDEAQKNTENSQQTMQTVEQLEEFSNELQTLVSQFKKTG